MGTLSQTEPPPSTDRASEPGGIELVGVTKTYEADGRRVDALRGVDLKIERGEFVCVLGPSGHGKTTMLSLIAGFIKPTTGRVLVGGSEVTGAGRDRGVVFQRDTLFLWKRVAANIEFGLRCQGMDKAARRKVVYDYLDLIGLREFANAWPKELSGGMRRRVAIAAVLANQPSVLLMDEPFVGLDFVRKAALHQFLLELWQRVGSTVFFVTHDIDEALVLGDRILLVVNGLVDHSFNIAYTRPRGEEFLSSVECVQIKSQILARMEEWIKGAGPGGELGKL